MTTTPCIRSPQPTGLLDGQNLPTMLLGTTANPVPGRQPPREAPAAVVLGDPGSCSPGGSDTWVIIDSSPSVESSDGNDPLSRRYDETALAIRHVAEACRCGCDRIALVPFDVGSPGQVASQPLTSRGVRRLDRGLQCLAGTRGMSSQLGPALDQAEGHITRQGPGSAVVVFSDFLLTDRNPSSALSRLRAFPGHVHAVVLGALPPDVLVADPKVTVTRLTPTSPPGAVARAVFDGLTRYRIHSPSHLGSAANTQIADDEGELIA